MPDTDLDQFGEPELLSYVAGVAESLLQVAEALYGGHQIGFPDIKGVTRQAVRTPKYLDIVLESVSDRTVLEELRGMRAYAEALSGVDEEISLWLSQYHKLPPPTDKASKERLLKIVGATSAEATHTTGFPPEWARQPRYKDLLALASEAIDGMREHKKRIDHRIANLLA